MAGWFDPAGIHTGLDFYRQIVESTHDCVKVLDLEGRLVYLTPKAQELLGICDLEGFLNRPWVDVWQEPWKAMAAAAVEAAKAGERGAFQGFCATLDGTPSGGTSSSRRSPGPADAGERQETIGPRAQDRNACGPTPPERLFASEAKRTSGLTKEQR